ncbi:MAG: hypothetical protein HY007_00280 [Candidatus Sungbacteria bacterium]|nr:hypothetical protein [Candidatus Sungbacteria bacterium]
MHLSIYSLRETIFEGEATSVSLPTPLGEMTVLDHHIPMVSAVSPGQIHYVLPDSTTTVLPFNGGILEVRPESSVIVLANP